MHTNKPFTIRNSNGVLRRPVNGPASITKVDVVAQKELLARRMATQTRALPTISRTNPAAKLNPGIVDTIEVLDADTAIEYLETNSDNRELRDRKVSEYMHAMLAGHWRLTHQGIAFDYNGVLLDGQHRLWALVMASEVNPDITIHMKVGRGYDPDTYRAIDCGAGRIEADLMKDANGDRMDRRTVAVAKAMVLGHRVGGGNFTRENSGKLPVEGLVGFINAYRGGIDWAIENLTGKQFSNATITAVFARAAIARPNDRAKLAEFIAFVRDSEPGVLSPKHPAALIRKVMEQKPKGSELYRKLEAAVLAFLDGSNISSLRGVEREHFVLPNWARDVLKES